MSSDAKGELAHSIGWLPSATNPDLIGSQGEHRNHTGSFASIARKRPPSKLGSFDWHSTAAVDVGAGACPGPRSW